MRRGALVLGVLVSCHSEPHATTPPPVATPPPVVVAAPVVVPVTEAVNEPIDAGGSVTFGGPPFETWQGGEIIVSLPAGTREKRPVVVGIHGSKDRPEASCARWRRTLGAYPFVVCPKGVPYRGGLAWGAPSGVAERIEGALAALRERHGADMAEGPVIYAGWSLGGTLGPKVVAARPGMFDTVVLVELGHTRLDATASAAALRASRASHVLVACATKRCAAFEKRLEKANASARSSPSLAFVDAGIGRGHLFDDRTARTIGAALAKVIASDPRWSGLADALEATAASADGGASTEPVPGEDDEPELVDEGKTK